MTRGRLGLVRLVLMAAGAAWVAAAGGVQAASAQTWATAQFSRQLQDESVVDVRVRYGAGRVAISPVSGTHLYRLRLEYDEEAFEPLHEYRDGRLDIGLTGASRRFPFRRSGDARAEMDLGLSTRVPMDLRLDFGAVQSVMDLGGVQLRTLEVTTGASDTELRVSAPNPFPMERAQLQVGAASFRADQLGNLNARAVEIEAGVGDVRLDFRGLRREETRVVAKMGLGSLEIRVPRGVGIRLERSTLLTSMSLPGFVERGGAHYSPEWDTADQRIMIEVEAAFGSISVVRTDD